MNEEQQKVYDFIIQRTRKGKEDEVKKLIMDGFEKQENNAFTKEYMEGMVPKLLALLRPECIGEFVKTVKKMSSENKK